EARPHLGPHHVAGHQRACAIRRAQRLTRSLAKLRVGPEDVQQHRRVDGRPHGRRERRRRRGGAFGRGPRMASTSASEEVPTTSRPYTRSTGCVPLAPLRSTASPPRTRNSTSVPVMSPSWSRTATGTVTWPFDEIRLRTCKEYFALP